MVFAYLDPGAGSMVIQTIIAAVVAVPFVLRSQIGRVMTRLRGRTGSTRAQPTSKDD